MPISNVDEAYRRPIILDFEHKQLRELSGQELPGFPPARKTRRRLLLLHIHQLRERRLYPSVKPATMTIAELRNFEYRITGYADTLEYKARHIRFLQKSLNSSAKAEVIQIFSDGSPDGELGQQSSWSFGEEVIVRPEDPSWFEHKCQDVWATIFPPTQTDAIDQTSDAWLHEWSEAMTVGQLRINDRRILSASRRENDNHGFAECWLKEANGSHGKWPLMFRDYAAQRLADAYIIAESLTPASEIVEELLGRENSDLYVSLRAQIMRARIHSCLDRFEKAREELAKVKSRKDLLGLADQALYHLTLSDVHRRQAGELRDLATEWLSWIREARTEARQSLVLYTRAAHLGGVAEAATQLCDITIAMTRNQMEPDATEMEAKRWLEFAKHIMTYFECSDARMWLLEGRLHAAYDGNEQEKREKAINCFKNAQEIALDRHIFHHYYLASLWHLRYLLEWGAREAILSSQPSDLAYAAIELYITFIEQLANHEVGRKDQVALYREKFAREFLKDLAISTIENEEFISKVRRNVCEQINAATKSAARGR